MMIWDFTLRIKGLAEFDDELTDRLYDAGCSDGTLGSSHGQAHIDFSRDAGSLQAAIRSAIADVQKCGLGVERAEIEGQALSQLAGSELRVAEAK